MASTRRLKWHQPPPPTPRILQLPRRPRRKAAKQVVSGKSQVVKETESRRNRRGKLESLLDQERSFSRTVPIVLLSNEECEKRERVEDFDNEFGGKGGDSGDDKWRFQAEILRAECHFLRMEREIALKKMEKNRAQMERTLRSAVETLISVRRKINEGKNVGVVLDEEIEDLEEKLKQLKRSSGVRDFDIRKCYNFDKQAVSLQKRLDKLGGISEDERVEEIREMAEQSLAINTNCRSDDTFLSSDRKTRFADVENLRRKMEGLSKGMLERMEEEYKSMLLPTATNSTSSSASTSRRIEFPDSMSFSSSSSSFDSTVMPAPSHRSKGTANTVCSGSCKSIVRKIVEQVRAETEQWSQMQEMLGQVREEMEELQASREFWEDRAFHYEDRIRSLHSTAHEWKQKALSSENMVSEMQKQITELRFELEKLKTEKQQHQKEQSRTRGLPPLPRESQKEEKEKRVLICRLKENHHMGSCNVGKKVKGEGLDDAKRRESKHSPLRDIGNSSPLNKQSSRLVTVAKRSPLRDVGNSSPLNKQSSKAVFPLYYREPSSHSQGSPLIAEMALKDKAINSLN